MDNYTISQMAKHVGLSRSTLLYYDRIGLLKPSGRSASGYRRYTDKNLDRLQRICALREAGLSLKEIQQMISAPGSQSSEILERRLAELGKQAVKIRQQQHQIAAMLQQLPGTKKTQVMDKTAWVNLLAAAGMDEQAMRNWHAEFERSAPEIHRDFLLSLGIPDAEVKTIRTWSALEQA
ncbi:MerR family transcriptional regulator [Tichowtungia aerotolerans]|uniref:MerR family transcriptional regulator n=1 Tax=Tichowtungia aerotolerans TaxID=2697043 RepID=A0A6P1MC27_9BACT|nr:MerR family transcriptional regulator [Tichowtungia aerotolerans]QHI69136.1 MerR family transcriptional regulator [Tichowtungia aerotolerans]